MTTDSEALRKSIDRGRAIDNCYLQLLSVIPKSNETAVYANHVSLLQKLTDWRGDWSMFNDHADEVVPYETKFVDLRKFYADSGLNMTNVPYVILKDNKLEPPEIITDAEAKARLSSPVAELSDPVDASKNLDTSEIVVMAALGAAAAFAGYKFLKPRRRTVAFKTIWKVGNREFNVYGEAVKEAKRTGKSFKTIRLVNKKV